MYILFTNIIITSIVLLMRKQNISGVMSFFSLFVMYYVSVSLLLFDFGKDMPFGFNRYIYDDILIYGTLVVLLSCIFYDIR